MRSHTRFAAVFVVIVASAGGAGVSPIVAGIGEAPVPIDLMTGKPFEYKVDGDTATLSAPIPPGAPNHSSFAIRFVLKVVK